MAVSKNSGALLESLNNKDHSTLASISGAPHSWNPPPPPLIYLGPTGPFGIRQGTRPRPRRPGAPGLSRGSGGGSRRRRCRRSGCEAEREPGKRTLRSRVGICTNMYMYMHTYACVPIHMYLYIKIDLCICKYISLSLYVYVYVYLYVYFYIYICILISKFIHAYIHTSPCNIYIYIQIVWYICIYVCLCICIYIYIFVLAYVYMYEGVFEDLGCTLLDGVVESGTPSARSRQSRRPVLGSWVSIPRMMVTRTKVELCSEKGPSTPKYEVCTPTTIHTIQMPNTETMEPRCSVSLDPIRVAD